MKMKKKKYKNKNKGKKSNLVESIIIIIWSKKMIEIAREWEKKRDDKF